MISFETMIPVRYNDGRDIPPDVTITILAMVDREFGGYTLDAASEGCWHGQVEYMRRLTVAIDDSKIDEARAMVKRIGQHLGQETMYFSINRNLVEIL